MKVRASCSSIHTGRESNPVPFSRESHTLSTKLSYPLPTVLTFSAICLGLLLTLLLFELHVAKVHDGAHYFVAAVLLLRQEAQDVHGVLQGRERQEGRSEREISALLLNHPPHLWLFSLSFNNKAEKVKVSRRCPSAPARRPCSPRWSLPGSRSGSRRGWSRPAACLC